MTQFTEVSAPGVAKTCLKTIALLIKNVIDDQENEKHRKVNLNNNAFQMRVVKVNGAVSILHAVGFKPLDDGSNMLKLDNPDQNVLTNALEQLSPHIE